ncbi:hypothetical protein ACF0H5_012698 [Mactra antiquata]
MLIDVFEDKVKAIPKKAFILYKESTYTYEDMDKMANKAARAAIEIGVKPGSTIAIMIHNHPSIVWSYLGFMKAGYQIALINIYLRSRPLSHSINSSGANVLILGEDPVLSEAILEIKDDIPNITTYVLGSSKQSTLFLSFDLVLSRVSDVTLDKNIRKHVLPTTPNMLIYTSGTTGLPKPALVTQVRTLGAAFGFEVFSISSDDVVYEPLPMYHSAALMIGFGNTITSGCTMVLREKFSASHFWEDCRRYNVTIIQYIGEVCRYLLAQPKSKDDKNHKVKVAFGNGLRQDIWTEFKERFNIERIVEFYGATEGPVGLINFTNRTGACGRSSPYMRQFNPTMFLKYDLEAQAPMRNKAGYCIPIDRDEVGLMVVPLIDGKTSFQGYRGKKEDSEKRLLYDVFEKGDKYYNSGDLFRVDKDYYVYFNDRIGDTFRWKGENVSTTEVSNILTDLDFVTDANVYGVLIPGTEGRAGMAALHLTDSNIGTLSPAMIASLSKHVRTVLPSYARPRFIRIQKQFDMTSTFKQQKTILVREGFDMNVISDPIFYLDISTYFYRPLDHEIYKQIMAGNIVF